MISYAHMSATVRKTVNVKGADLDFAKRDRKRLLGEDAPSEDVFFSPYIRRLIMLRRQALRSESTESKETKAA